MEPRHQYHIVARYLHATLVILIAIQFLSGWTMSSLRGGVSTMASIHLSFGVIVMPIALALLFMRFFRPVYRPEMEAPGLQERASVLVHYLLYALLLIVPFTGWAFVSARNIPVSFFGLFDLPQIVATGSSFGRALGGLHEGVASLIGFIILGHIAAALYHHFYLKDGLLNRMAPLSPAREPANTVAENPVRK